MAIKYNVKNSIRARKNGRDINNITYYDSNKKNHFTKKSIESKNQKTSYSLGKFYINKD